MTISATTTRNTLLTALTTQGLSSTKAKLVENDLQASIKTVAAGGGTVDKTAVRAVLDQRIAADVVSGQLSQKDADAVKATLDETNGTATDAASAASGSQAAAATNTTGGSAAAGGGGAGGGGGGGGSSAKTELSRTVVVTGAMETITITYTDGTTAVETEASTAGASTKKATTAATTGPSGAASTDPYAETIAPGSLVDQIA